MDSDDPTWCELKRLMTQGDRPGEEIPLEESALLAALSAESSPMTGISRLDLAGLARHLGVARVAVARRLDSLQARGYLAILPARNGRHLYRLLRQRPR